MRTLEGLYILIKAKVARRKVCRATAADRAVSAIDAHDAGFEVQQLDREIPNLHTAIQEDEKFIRDIENLVTALSQSPIKSAHRQLALRHLEDASMRLRRDLGDKPADSLSAER